MTNQLSTVYINGEHVPVGAARRAERGPGGDESPLRVERQPVEPLAPAIEIDGR